MIFEKRSFEESRRLTGEYPRRYMVIYTPPPNCHALVLTNDAEYVANLVDINVVVNVQHCSSLHGYAIPA